MRSIIIEDNPSVRNTLSNMLSEYCPQVELVGEASNVLEGSALIMAKKPELAFLDVELPDGNTFELLKSLPSVDFQVIFITGHEKYAMNAIKFSALDFILKPIDPDDLVMAIQKAEEQVQKPDVDKKIQTLFQNLESKDDGPNKIILKDKYGLQIVSVDQIVRLEASGSYTTFVIDQEEQLVISKGLKEYEQLLNAQKFFRCHQSHIVNLDYLKRYDKREGDFLQMVDGSMVPLAVRKKEILMEKIKERY
ncbi:MAG: LytTR family DNA-binding domain-containing protein [Bacteroidota bacterium]